MPKPLAVQPSDGNTNYTVIGGEPKKNRRSKREAIIPAEEFIDSSGRSLSVVIMVGALRHRRHYLVMTISALLADFVGRMCVLFSAEP